MQKPATTMQFVRIAPGEYLMGCSPGDDQGADDERPSHRVRITKAFDLAKYEVTQDEWMSVMGENPSEFPGLNRPVEHVSYFDALEFLRRLNSRQDGYRYRLPTEAEWEYAARAGVTTATIGVLGDVAWYFTNSHNETHPVGEKKPN